MLYEHKIYQKKQNCNILGVCFLTFSDFDHILISSRYQGPGIRDQGSGNMDQGTGIMEQGSGYTVQGSGNRKL